jgi:protocatechuate 3,4-dioxygenase beta subunit
LTPSLNRRDALKAAFAGGAVLLGGARLLGEASTDEALAAGACKLAASQEEGPFYVALERIRSDIRLGRTGVPLRLRITVTDSSTCRPVKGAAVDIWHADGLGEYSDESSEGTVGQTWLRGVQLTDADGLVKFTTIYPGFYAGRAPHIHAKVHTGGSRTSTRYTGGHVVHTGQFFFPEAISTRVYRTSPYTKDANTRTRNAEDRVYTGQHGAGSILKITGSPATGLQARITLAVAA